MLHAIECIVEHKSLKLNQRFTYLAPSNVLRGMRVEIEFNRQHCVALVMDVFSLDHPKVQALAQQVTLKPILRVLDEEGLLNDELMALGLWLADHTLAPIISCFQVMLPKVKQISSKRIKIQHVYWVRALHTPVKVTVKQQHVLAALKEGPEVYQTIKQTYGSAVDTLIKQGVIERYAQEKHYRPQARAAKTLPYTLSLEQTQAIKNIQETRHDIVCLYGPTGSGKTEIYLHLAEAVRSQGREMLIMVPEIALTHQMVERVEARFGEDVIVYHSNLSAYERYLQYQRVLNRQSNIVIGTRSSIFLPFHDLAYIVLDEEHDHSYKQEAQPYYHARDVAIERARHHRAKLILGSATPSFETYARALKGTYGLIELKQRIKGELPKMRLISTKPSLGLLHPSLVQALQENVDRHHQSLILINRRGYAPILQCIECAQAICCQACDRAMVVHKSEGVLKCHSCGAQIPIPQHCPSCHSSQLRQLGYGTQKIEEALQQKLPKARILRMDRDTTRQKNAHQKLLRAFENHEADILLGTQMISKGLDIETVTLSVLLDIDRSLLRSDYRSVEDAFSLIVQTAGRSGRSHLESEVLIQTTLPNHDVLTYAMAHNYKAFFKLEMKARQLAQNPPYTYLISILLFDQDSSSGLAKAYALKEQLQHDSFLVLGPSDLGKLQNRHRIRLILKGKDFEAMRAHVQTILSQHEALHEYELVVDTHPLSLL